jgi:hypothetical protein
VDFDKGLNVAVTKLRATLNDSPETPTYIVTIAGEAYRFMAEVEQVFAMISASASAQQIAKGEAPSSSLMHLSPAFVPEQDAQHAPFLPAAYPPRCTNGRRGEALQARSAFSYSQFWSQNCSGNPNRHMPEK